MKGQEDTTEQTISAQYITMVLQQQHAHSVWLGLTLPLLLSAVHASAFLPFISNSRHGIVSAPVATSMSTTIRTRGRVVPSAASPLTLPLRFANKDWDKILADDDDDDTAIDNGPPAAPDMQYNERNVMRQNQHFVAIREAAGKELTADVYCREPKKEAFWFIGKVARVSDVTVEQAVGRQWSLIETHAANLRPLELFAARGSLELWTAPGDSELEVAYNNAELVFQRMERDVDGAAKVKNILIGFQGEMYEAGEQGFRTWRLDDGSAARPEVQAPPEEETASKEEIRPPTAEEMEQLQKSMEGKDINDFYEEQQRREGKSLD